MTEEELLALEGIAWLNAVVYRESLGSTNDLALRQELAEGDGWGWLFVADEQTAGRGRRGNTWWAGAGALTFSLVVDAERLALKPDKWPLLPLAAGLAVRDAVALELPDVDVRIKWPNDVYLNDRKVAGILVEQRQDASTRLVIGVGVNVNTPMTTAPGELADAAISLAQVSERQHRLSELLAGILLALAQHASAITVDLERLIGSLNAHSYLNGRQVRVDDGGALVMGRCRGIAENGALSLVTENGVRQVVSGTVVAID